jgi:hypothetical protein
MKLKQITLNPEKIIVFWSICLLGLGLFDLSRGFYHLLFIDNAAEDLFSRWQEQQYIYRGLYPYDVRLGSPYVAPEIGAIRSAGYPPWAFFAGFIFLPPLSWEFTRIYYAFLNLISLAVLLRFAYQIRIIKDSKSFANLGYSGINIITNFGIDPRMATLILSCAATLVTLMIFYIWRNYSLLTLFATASVIGRFWGYHRIYDDIMLIFLLLALLEVTFKNPHKLNIFFSSLAVTVFCFTKLFWWIFRTQINTTNNVAFLIMFVSILLLGYLLM